MVKDASGKHIGYYEAILQLRDTQDETRDYVEEEIKQQHIHVAKTVALRNGVDIYLGDSKFTRNVGKALQLKFGGEYVVTATLFSKKDGKEIYRLTVLFRGLPFRKGDMIEYKGDPCRVLVLGKEIIIQSKTGKKIHVKYKDVESIRALE